jgi:hypothetical protein
MDTSDTRVQNLLFLLMAAPLGVACVITDDGTTDTEASTRGTTEGTGSTTETPPGTDTVVVTGTAESTTADDRGDSTTETPADTTMTPADSTTTGGGDIPPACVAYGDAIEACFAGYGADAAASCANYHATYNENYGAECVAAYEDFLACLSMLTCKELEMDPDTVCVAEQDAQAMACVAK